MTQEDKLLLLTDLCARLPYGVKITWDGKHSLTVTPHIYCAIASEDKIDNLPKLLLRPMSSMTEEERIAYLNACDADDDVLSSPRYSGIDRLNVNHFDYRGLIPKGLAIAITEQNNPYKD